MSSLTKWLMVIFVIVMILCFPLEAKQQGVNVTITQERCVNKYKLGPSNCVRFIRYIMRLSAIEGTYHDSMTCSTIKGLLYDFGGIIPPNSKTDPEYNQIYYDLYSRTEDIKSYYNTYCVGR